MVGFPRARAHCASINYVTVCALPNKGRHFERGKLRPCLARGKFRDADGAFPGLLRWRCSCRAGTAAASRRLPAGTAGAATTLELWGCWGSDGSCCSQARFARDDRGREWP